MVIAERGDHLRCEFCGGASFPKETKDGVRPLGEPSGGECPGCKKPLSAAVIERIPVEHCGSCEGFLIARRDLVSVVMTRRALYDGPKIPGRPISPEEGKRKLDCPLCGESMECHPYHGPGHVWIDSCASCDKVWLDRGELTKIERS